MEEVPKDEVWLGLDDVRSRLPELVTAAGDAGRSTVITRRGKPAAAIVPLPVLRASRARAGRDLLAMAGSGRGLWGDPADAVYRLRAEWR